ncbi:MAG: hypothetical protein J5506_03960 [Prevotella sp.]|nr:hypothetical protein [Prevotella sp.]
MKQTQKILMTLFIAIVAVALLMVLLFETNVIEPGSLAGRESVEFNVLSIVELATVFAIPLALRLFRFKKIKSQLVASPASKLRLWGIVRLLMLGLPLLACVLFYYLFFMKAAFGYLAIILLLSMLFVWPSMGKCESETTA